MYRHFNFKKADRKEIEGNVVGGGEKKETGKNIFKTDTYKPQCPEKSTVSNST